MFWQKNTKRRKMITFMGEKWNLLCFHSKLAYFYVKVVFYAILQCFTQNLQKKRKNSIFYGRKVKKFMFQFKTCLFLRKSIIFCNFLVFWQKLTKRRKMTTFMGDKRYSNLSIRPRQVHLGRCGLFGATITKILAY